MLWINFFYQPGEKLDFTHTHQARLDRGSSATTAKAWRSKHAQKCCKRVRALPRSNLKWNRIAWLWSRDSGKSKKLRGKGWVGSVAIEGFVSTKAKHWGCQWHLWHPRFRRPCRSGTERGITPLAASAMCTLSENGWMCSICALHFTPYQYMHQKFVARNVHFNIIIVPPTPTPTAVRGNLKCSELRFASLLNIFSDWLFLIRKLYFGQSKGTILYQWTLWRFFVVS